MKDSNYLTNLSINKDLIRLFIGQSISSIGNSFTGMALTWFIINNGTPLQVGMRIALAFLPNILLSPFIGNIVDRTSRKLLLWGSDALRLLLDILLIIIISFGFFNIYIIYAYTLIQSVLRLFFEPAKRSIIQQLTVKDQRVKVNAVESLFMRAGMVIGPSLAGLAVKNFSKQLVIGFDALTFLMAIIIVLTIKLDEQHITKVKKQKDYFQQMHDGWSYVKKHVWILLLSAGYSFVNGGNSLSSVSKPYFIKEVLKLNVDSLGFLSSAGSFGAILVSMILVKIKLKGYKLNYVIMSVLICGSGLVLFSVVNNYTQLLFIQVFAFSMGPIMAICGNSFYQNQIPPDYMGRVYAVRSMVSSLAMPVGALFGAGVINLVGIRGSFIVAGTVVLIGALLIYLAKVVHKSQSNQQITTSVKTV